MEAGIDERPPQDAVRLRPWAEHDLDLLRRVNAPDMTAHLGGPEADDQVVARHEKYLRLWREGTARMFVIEVGEVACPGIDNAASNALCRSTGFTCTGSGVEPWRGGELAFHVWVLDISEGDLAGRERER